MFVFEENRVKVGTETRPAVKAFAEVVGGFFVLLCPFMRSFTRHDRDSPLDVDKIALNPLVVAFFRCWGRPPKGHFQWNPGYLNSILISLSFFHSPRLLLLAMMSLHVIELTCNMKLAFE